MKVVRLATITAVTAALLLASQAGIASARDLDPFNPGAFLKILKHHATTRPARAEARHPKPSKNNKPPAPPAVAPYSLKRRRCGLAR